MRLAIMQPYFFPYLGYFQLMRAVDTFVFYDDVSFIKGGWINRNRLLLDGAPRYFTVPLEGASSFVPIRAVHVNRQNPRWIEKMVETFRAAYRKAPHRDVGLGLLERVLALGCTSIADLARASVEAAAQVLGVTPRLVPSSTGYANTELKGQARVLDICRREGATRYVNAIGGRDLYDGAPFAAQGCELRFLEPRLAPYEQGTPAFVPGLSILDVLMRVPVAQARAFVDDYALLEPAATSLR